MSKQTDFGPLARYGTREWIDEARENIYRRIADIVAHVDSHKTVAEALGRRSRSDVTYAIKPSPEMRKGHRFYVDDLPWLTLHAPNDDLACSLLALTEEPLSPAEENLALRQAIFEDLPTRAYKRTLSRMRTIAARNRLRTRRIGGEK